MRAGGKIVENKTKDVNRFDKQDAGPRAYSPAASRMRVLGTVPKRRSAAPIVVTRAGGTNYRGITPARRGSRQPSIKERVGTVFSNS